MNLYSAFLIILMILFSCKSGNVLQVKEKDLIEKNNLKSNLYFLASDELEGREAATRGERVASRYIANELQRYGVKPYGDANTYFQNFTLYENGYDVEKMSMAIVDKNGNTIEELQYGKEFAAFANTAMDLDARFELVFVSYGITAPEYDYNNYKDIDVKGKFVVVLPGEPSDGTDNFFNGEKSTQYSLSFTKARNAFIHGAAGMIILPDEVEKYGFDAMVNYIGGSMLNLKKPGAANIKYPNIFMNEASMTSLFESDGKQFSDYIEKAKNGTLDTSFTFKNQVKIKLNRINSRARKARNVIGVIEGNDPILKKEYVAVAAHYDHLGKRGEKIYNGADDDASGTAAVMEVAKAFAKSKKNKRSILVVFHTAEEKGLYGSKYLTENFKEINQIVSNINIDMVGRQATDSLHVIGSDRLSNELHDIVIDVNNKVTKFKFDFKYNDPNDPNRFYERSDHYNYASKNIPIVFFFDDMRKDYHKETDTSEKINYSKLAKVSKLVYNIALKIANLDHRLKLN